MEKQTEIESLREALRECSRIAGSGKEAYVEDCCDFFDSIQQVCEAALKPADRGRAPEDRATCDECKGTGLGRSTLDCHMCDGTGRAPDRREES